MSKELDALSGVETPSLTNFWNWVKKKAVGGTKVISGAAAKKAAAKTKTGVGSAPVESDVTPVG